MNALLLQIGPLLNESLSAAIAIISGSFFLYSLVKDIRNSVARAFSLLLFFVTVTYIGDLGVTFSGSLYSAETWLRFQWIGIAFAPAAYVHVSDAVLSMTGLPSRGRRRRTVRFLYIVAAVFLILVVSTDLVVRDPLGEPAPHFQPGPAFAIFLLYFIGSVVLSLWFIIRARRRTLTQSTRLRMTYLVLTYPAPALAVFPFLLISGQSQLSPVLFYGVLLFVDAVLAVMLTFMSYVIAFVGSLLPDRLIKSQMLQFFLRGPIVAIATLAVIVWVPRAGAVLGLPGDQVMPFLAVTTILFLQWTITFVRPFLERWLIFTRDHSEVRRIRELEDRLLTTADFQQLLDSILATLCDFLRVDAAFIATIAESGPRLERAIGLHDEVAGALSQSSELSRNGEFRDVLETAEINGSGEVLTWRGYWLIPLHGPGDRTGERALIGVLGVTEPGETEPSHDHERWEVLMALATRAAEALRDRALQVDIFGSLEDLLPEMAAIQRLRGRAQYGGVESLTSDEDVVSSPDFAARVKDALGQYWGGPRLTDNALMNLAVVRQALDENEGNPQRAMRAVLQQAIENLRPEGQRSMTTAEWILYNILEMRFIQGRKVREVAMRLAMSESDLYRKQRIAIESVAAIIGDMERAAAASEPAESLEASHSG